MKTGRERRGGTFNYLACANCILHWEKKKLFNMRLDALISALEKTDCKRWRARGDSPLPSSSFTTSPTHRLSALLTHPCTRTPPLSLFFLPFLHCRMVRSGAHAGRHRGIPSVWRRPAEEGPGPTGRDHLEDPAGGDGPRFCKQTEGERGRHGGR